MIKAALQNFPIVKTYSNSQPSMSKSTSIKYRLIHHNLVRRNHFQPHKIKQWINRLKWLLTCH